MVLNSESQKRVDFLLINHLCNSLHPIFSFTTVSLFAFHLIWPLQTVKCINGDAIVIRPAPLWSKVVVTPLFLIDDFYDARLLEKKCLSKLNFLTLVKGINSKLVNSIRVLPFYLLLTVFLNCNFLTWLSIQEISHCSHHDPTSPCLTSHGSLEHSFMIQDIP